MKKTLLEAGKSLAIVLLFCSLLLLTMAAMPVDMIRSTPWLSNLLQPLAPILGLQSAELIYVADGQTVLDAAQPLAISVRNNSGRFSALWDPDGLDAAYETLGGMLGQALDTSEAFEAVTDEQVITALSRPSLCFDYGFSLPAQVLGSWLKADLEGAAAGQRYILAVENDKVVLYLSGDPSYRAETAVNGAALVELLNQYKPDGSQFAFETDSHLADLALIPGFDPVMEAAVSTSPCDNRYIETVATAYGFNPYEANRYTDSAGVTYFSETNCSLQIASSGEILLTSDSPDRFQAEGTSLAALVESARSLIHLAVGDILGDARLYLSGVTEVSGKTTVTFDYVLNGIAVSCGGKPAAAVVFEGGAVTSMELLATVFSETGEPLKILPADQVSAIIPNGGDLVLQYHRSGLGALTAGWAK